MNRRVVYLCRAVGLLLLLVTATGVLFPATAVGEDTTALALRQIGHNYLLATGDSTTRVPPVKVDGDAFTLNLNANIQYDLLNQISRKVLHRYGIKRDYTLSLTDCQSGEVFLGSLWPAPLHLNDTDLEAVACTGRDQEDRCANIGLAFAPEAATGPPVWTWVLGGMGLLLLLTPARATSPATPPPAKLRTVEHPAEPIAPIQPVSLTNQAVVYEPVPAVCFAVDTNLLTVSGTEYTLTHREAKLLQYFLDRPNVVLPRQEIHDAVWGAEGVITGRSLDVFVSRLRKKLIGASGVGIVTVHGLGYRLVVGR